MVACLQVLLVWAVAFVLSTLVRTRSSCSWAGPFLPPRHSPAIARQACICTYNFRLQLSNCLQECGLVQCLAKPCERQRTSTVVRAPRLYLECAQDFGDELVNARASDIAVGLMWIGSIWWVLKIGIRTVAELVLPGALPIERSAVCGNTGFMLHRNNEFMYD